MVDETEGKDRSREPTEDDIIRIVTELNSHGVRYAMVGGIALQMLGSARATMDVDLLVDPSADNVERIRRALSILEDKAVLEVRASDVEEYGVVRVADEIVVDLIGRAGGMTLAELDGERTTLFVRDTQVATLTPRGLLKTKQTGRPKDVPDVLFLEALLSEVEGTK